MGIETDELLLGVISGDESIILIYARSATLRHSVGNNIREKQPSDCYCDCERFRENLRISFEQSVSILV